MPHRPLPMCLSRRRALGFTRSEMLTVLIVAAILVATLIPAALKSHGPSRSAMCKTNLRSLGIAMVGYLKEYQYHLPRSWSISGDRLAPDLANLVYWRRALHPYYNRSTPLPTSAEGLARYSSAWLAVQDETEYWPWICPVKGATRDYFGSPVVFGFPQSPSQPDPRTARTDDFAVPTERPAIAEVNASLPDPDATSDDRGHEAELRSGFSVRRVGGTPVFIGVGQSLRDPARSATSRLDHRHGPRAQVLFLDCRIGDVSDPDPEALPRFHRRWNFLTPTNDRSAP